jgi:hypothetical protein
VHFCRPAGRPFSLFPDLNLSPFPRFAQEPYPIEQWDNTFKTFDKPSDQDVRSFQCRVGQTREGYRYNLSVAVLGEDKDNPELFWTGEGIFARHLVVADHEGVNYMISQMARIDSITPNVTGTLGGDRITITGDGFAPDMTVIEVDVAGIPCAVVFSAIDQIICEIGSIAGQSLPSLGDTQPGDRGIKRSIWWNAAKDDDLQSRSAKARSEGQLDVYNTTSEEWTKQSPAIVEIERAFFRAPVQLHEGQLHHGMDLR